MITSNKRILDSKVGFSELLLIYSWASPATAGDNTQTCGETHLVLPFPHIARGRGCQGRMASGRFVAAYGMPSGKPVLLFELPARIHSHGKS